MPMVASQYHPMSPPSRGAPCIRSVTSGGQE
nr:MAG TPA: hypothetical protein [Bacteriophage sp.]